MEFNLKTLCLSCVLLCSSDVLATDAFVNLDDGGFTPVKEIGGVPVTLRPLDNDKCIKINPSTDKKERVFRERNKGEQEIKGIVLHYSVCSNADVLENVFYSGGVSSHYDVDFDGEIFEFVDPKNIAFHAGESAWNGTIAMNKNFIGIEQNMWGYYESRFEKIYDYEKFGKPVQLPGDDRKWFKFSDKQVKSTGRLIFALQQEYKIPGRFVVTHSDVAIGKKSDSGPMFPYKKIFKKYGAGYYPKSKYINLDKFWRLTDDDYIKLLEIYGYNRGENGRAPDLSDQEIIKAFKLHFYPGDLSEDLNDSTKKMILNLIASYFNYKDRITKDFDREFRKDLIRFLCENKSRTEDLAYFVVKWKNYSHVDEFFARTSRFFHKFIGFFRR